MLYKFIFLAGILIILSACEASSSSDHSATKSAILTINESQSLTRDLSRQDLPMSDQIRLYNLDVQSQDLTLSSLRSVVEQQHQPHSLLNWKLPNPEAPRPYISTAPSWIQGLESLTPDTIQFDILCSYGSYPCSTLISSLQELIPLLTTPYQVRFYDFPQTFHRLGVDAAAAVQCIEEGAQQNLKNYLWIQNGQLDTAGLKGAIELYSTYPNDTLKCMDDPKTLQAINEKISQLAQAGFNKTPSILMNGQYLARGKEMQLVVQHLTPHLELPISVVKPEAHWLQSWGSKNVKFSWALIKYQGKTRRVIPGEKLGDMFVAHITDNNLGMIKDGQLLWLNSVPSTTNVADISISNKVSATHAQPTNMLYAEYIEDPHEIMATEQQSAQEPPVDDQERFERMINAVKTQPLPQSWLEQQLMRQTELEESLSLTENKMEGKSLVKLHAQEIDSFYTSLGMLPGDVILRVNDQWIHEENNSLFQSLAHDEKVMVSVMRNGLPVHFSFVIEE